MTDSMKPFPPPDDLSGSDFLFHLYRGAELLQDNQVHEAKNEIERALRMQPREPQGQDLLAQVYFRLGLYPRAISIYESLASAFPDEVTPRINLALCYLKTGQPERAREQLESVVSAQPTKQRAWGYLGLAFERLGDYEKAKAAFDRAGYTTKVRRMNSLLQKQDPGVIETQDVPAVDLSELRSVAEAAFHELDIGDDAFSLALPSADIPQAHSGLWLAIEPGQSKVQHSSPPSVRVSSWITSSRQGPKPCSEPPLSPRLSNTTTLSIDDFAKQAILCAASDDRVQKRDDSTLVSLRGDFLSRIDLVCAFTFSSPSISASSTVPRYPQGDSTIPLGGATRPFVVFENAEQLLVRPRPSHELFSIELDEEGVYLREDCLGGFDRKAHYDCGHLPSGYGDTIPLVHLWGNGLALFEFPLEFAALEVEKECILRSGSVLGWVGRLVSRNIPASDCPGSIPGWTILTGTGIVFVDPEQEPRL